jgi:polysaccharide export outer membrane protein
MTLALAAAGLLLGSSSPAMAQTPCGPNAAEAAQAAGNGATGVEGTRATLLAPPPNTYIIGADDLLQIAFWQEPTMSGEVKVRPDGMISLPLVNDILAAGLTPEQLGCEIAEAAKQFFQEPTVTVIVKAILSRRVYITGQVAKPGPYDMTGPLTVLQLITLAGGVAEYANKKEIQVIRTEAGKTVSYRVNYDDISKGKNLGQNIELRPGDQVIVR